MDGSKRFIPVLLCGVAVSGILAFGRAARAFEAADGASESSALIGVLETIKGLFGQAETLTAESAKSTAQEGAAGTDAGTWEDTAGRIWQGVKDFFNDRTARGLLLDTLKLFLRLIVNIFTIIANLFGKILAALS